MLSEGGKTNVKDKHKIASDAFLELNNAGKPRVGPLHYWMQKTTANYGTANSKKRQSVLT